MKAPDFSYCRPSTTEEAYAILAEFGSDARVLAGGQSLMASLNLRLAAPTLLVDINRIDSLKGIEYDPSTHELCIKALARHADTARSELVANHAPLLTLAMRHVAHPAIQNRGTTCGSIALADPSAEMPACALALDARIVLESQAGGRRSVPASDFFLGLYETARRDDELITEVRYPCRAPDDVFGFDELSRRHGDFAIAGVCVSGRRRGDRIQNLRLTVFGTDPIPIRCEAARAADDADWTEALIAHIADAASRELNPDDGPYGSPRVRRIQAAALIRRTLSGTFPTQD